MKGGGKKRKRMHHEPDGKRKENPDMNAAVPSGEKKGGT